MFLVRYSCDFKMVPVRKTLASVAAYKTTAFLHVSNAELFAPNIGKELATHVVVRY